MNPDHTAPKNIRDEREHKDFTLIQQLNFVLKMLSVFYICCNTQVHFRLDFFMEASNMNPDHTATENTGL